MATTIHYPSESSTIDALWTILSQQTENVKRALSARLKDSLSQNENAVRTRNLNEAMAFVDTLSLKGKTSVPADENGIEALINEDISGY
jgi:hypothetical protein